MSKRPAFLTATGVVLGVVTLAVVVAWAWVAGPVMFSPGPLSARATGARTLGGVSNHAQLAGNCGACHPAPWSSQTMADRCLACHQNVSSQIASRSGLHGAMLRSLSAPTCRGCHPDHHGRGGALTTLDAAKFPHDLTGYSLRGHRRTPSGAKVTCKDCHPRDLSHFDVATCNPCHVALNASFMTRHVAQFGRACLSCHNGTDRLGANFDHNQTPFKLTGKHKTVACDACHSIATGSLAGLLNSPQDCFPCHAKNDKHAGAFGRQCGQCHSTDTWLNAKFNHTIFPVDHGRSERVATCKTCHPVDPSTYDCYGCHAHTPASVLADHEGQSLASLSHCIICHPGGRKGGD